MILSAVSSNRAVNFAPETVAEEIAQNILTIISTPKYSVPLDRSFGIDARCVDMPIMQAQAAHSSEIFQAIREYEPRVSINRITFTADVDGVLKPTVEVTINET